MAGELWQFLWQVPESGFEWIDARMPAGAKEAWKLVAAETRDWTIGRSLVELPSSRAQVYEPLQDHPALCRIFADTDPSESGILVFANRYGPLGIQSFVLPPKAKDASTAVLGEPLLGWMGQLGAMKLAIELWDMVRTGDLGFLSRRVQWKDSAIGSYRQVDFIWNDREELIASADSSQEWLHRFRAGDVIQPARVMLHRFVNRELAKRNIAPQLLIDPSNWDSVYRVVPENLISALWLQLAHVISEKRNHRQCRTCRGWFEVARGHARADKVFCSPACRTKFHRLRESARQLKKQGKQSTQIAKLLGVGIDTVTEWLTNETRATP